MILLSRPPIVFAYESRRGYSFPTGDLVFFFCLIRLVKEKYTYCYNLVMIFYLQIITLAHCR